MNDLRFTDLIHGVAAEEILRLESDHARSERFAALDNLVADITTRAFTGERVANTAKRKNHDDVLTLCEISATGRSFIDEAFTLAHQQSRGAWFLQEDSVTIRSGVCNLPYRLASQPRYALTLAHDERARTRYSTSSDALFIWSVLIDVFATLCAPIIALADPKLLVPAAADARWNEVTATFRELGLELDDLLTRLRSAPPNALGSFEQLDLRAAFMSSIAPQITAETTARIRAMRIRELVDAHRAKSKRAAPLARSVVTAKRRPQLVGFFAGSWLAFLEYLDAEPAEGETVETALPEPRVYVVDGKGVERVAASTDVPPDEVTRMLAAQGLITEAASPITQRIDVMRRYWQAFNHAHATQESGGPSLWGLAETVITPPDDPARASDPRLAERMLDPELWTAIRSLWGTRALKQHPDRLFTEYMPLNAMAETFGAALKFWHGVALTAWFVCEGPMSRTTLDQLATYHERELHELNHLEATVDAQLFVELTEIDAQLEPVEQIVETVAHSTADGLKVSMQVSRGSRRGGFEQVRDVVTRHRQEWAEAHLHRYLTTRWEHDVLAVAREYSRRQADKARPPTAKALASFATPAANSWFGGSRDALCAAIGEPSPGPQQRASAYHGNIVDLVDSVFAQIGGRRLTYEEGLADVDARRVQGAIRRLIHRIPRYLELVERLEHEPSVDELDSALRAEHDEDPDRWDQFVRAMNEARIQPTELHAPTRTEAQTRASKSTSAPPRHETPASQPKRRLFDRFRRR